MKIRKIIGKTMFKPSFGAKRGTTDFYQAFSDDGLRLCEIEVNPNSKLGKPEIMSIYSDYEGRGAAKFLVNKILDMYLNDIVYVRVTKESEPFWIHMGAQQISGDMYAFKKQSIMESNQDEYFTKLPSSFTHNKKEMKFEDFTDHESDLIDGYLDKLPISIEYIYTPITKKDRFPKYVISHNQKPYLYIWKLFDDYFLVRSSGWEEWKCDQIDGLFVFLDWVIKKWFNIEPHK
jgi:hypothetical protein